MFFLSVRAGMERQRNKFSSMVFAEEATMSIARIKTLTALLTVLASALGVTSQTFAYTTHAYPGPMCSFESQSVSSSRKTYPAKEHPGKIRIPNATGKIVTCSVPLPKIKSGFREHLSTKVSVVVKYLRTEGELPMKCRLRWSTADNSQISTANSALQVGSDHRGHSEFFFSERVPPSSSVVLRCEIPSGTRLRGYSVR